MTGSKRRTFYSVTSDCFHYEENVQEGTPSHFTAILFPHKLLRLNSRHNRSCNISQGIPAHDVPAYWTLKIYCFAIKGNM